jgi:hypothetical protein
MFDKSSERSDRVSVDAEASDLLRTLALPAVPGERVAAAISRAAARAGLTFNRARSIWYAEARAILAEEMDQLRMRASAARGARNDEMRRDYDDVERRLGAIEAELVALRQGIAGARADRAG